MTVQDAVRTLPLPRQAGPQDRRSVPAAARTAAAPRLGRDRPLDREERQFVLGLVGVLACVESVIVTGLLTAQYVWS